MTAPGVVAKSGQKRRREADDAEEERPIKHRASLACQSCRSRKVRCDVLANGTRCTNCRLDQLECVVLPSRRGKVSRSRPNREVQPTEHQSPQSTKPATKGLLPVPKSDALTTPDSGADSVPACVSFEDELDDADREERPANSPSVEQAADVSRAGPYAGVSTPRIRPDTANHQGEWSDGISLPPYVEPLSSRIPAQDAEFLQRKGALILPESDLQKEILQAYLFSVHPFMPMLDYRKFVRSMFDGGESGGISLLLFQAVMFAGLHSLQLSTINRLGFESAKQARGVFFNRVRLLYEFDVEPDIAAVLQSLILMSSWYSKWDGRRDTWHWTGLAYDVARRMGLHREPSMHSTSKARSLRKRMFWSLYIRDRMIALGTRRPMRIEDEDFDVSMLSLEDFDLDPLEMTDQSHTLIPTTQELKSTALMCIQVATLSRIIGRIVKSQYTMTRPHRGQDIPHTVMVISKRNDTTSADLEACDCELNQWFESLPQNIELTGPVTGMSSSKSCADVHKAMLVLTYQTAVNVLHRPRALRPVSDTGGAQSAQSHSRAKVKDSARRLTKLTQNMLRHDQIRFLGLVGVTAVIATYLSHMLDVGSSDEDVRDAATFRLHQSLEALHALRQIYASADAAVTFLASVSRKAGIAVPAFEAELASAGATGVSSKGGTHRREQYRDVGAAPHGDLTLHTAGLQAMPESSGNSHPRSPQPRIGSEGQLLSPNDSLHSHATAMAMLESSQSNTAQDWANPESRPHTYNSPHFLDPPLAGLSNANFDSNIFDWDGGIDFGMDIAPLSFNFDFYSDAL